MWRWHCGASCASFRLVRCVIMALESTVGLRGGISTSVGGEIDSVTAEHAGLDIWKKDWIWSNRVTDLFWNKSSRSVWCYCFLELCVVAVLVVWVSGVFFVGLAWWPALRCSCKLQPCNYIKYQGLSLKLCMSFWLCKVFICNADGKIVIVLF